MDGTCCYDGQEVKDTYEDTSGKMSFVGVAKFHAQAKPHFLPVPIPKSKIIINIGDLKIATNYFGDYYIQDAEFQITLIYETTEPCNFRCKK